MARVSLARFFAIYSKSLRRVLASIYSKSLRRLRARDIP